MASVVSGWHFNPLDDRKKAERDVLLRMIVRAARALASGRYVRCNDFAFEQRETVRTPVEGRPGVVREREAHTLHPDEAWLDAHGEGYYRLEVVVQVNQADRAGRAPAAVRDAVEVLVGAQMEEAEERVQRTRRRRSRAAVLRSADLARVLAMLRRRDVAEERDVLRA